MKGFSHISDFNMLKKLESLDPEIKELFIYILRQLDEVKSNLITKVEFDELKKTVAQLVKEQRKLAKVQRRTEERLNELEEAQRKTEGELYKLIKKHKKTREMVESLQHPVGYVLEDRAIGGLPKLLEKDFGIKVESLKRTHFEVAPNTYLKVNLFEEGRDEEGKKVYIIGECKTQIKKREVDNTVKRLDKKINDAQKIFIIVAYQVYPIIQEYLNKKGIKFYFSYLLSL